MHMYTHVYRGQKWILDSVFNHSPFYCLRQELSMNPKLTIPLGWLANKPLGPSCSQLCSAGITRVLMVMWHVPYWPSYLPSSMDISCSVSHRLLLQVFPSPCWVPECDLSNFLLFTCHCLSIFLGFDACNYLKEKIWIRIYPWTPKPISIWSFLLLSMIRKNRVTQDLVDGRDLKVSLRLFLPFLSMSSLVSRDGSLQYHSFQWMNCPGY